MIHHTAVRHAKRLRLYVEKYPHAMRRDRWFQAWLKYVSALTDPTSAEPMEDRAKRLRSERVATILTRALLFLLAGAAGYYLAHPFPLFP